jgi:hypothetical protein
MNTCVTASNPTGAMPAAEPSGPAAQRTPGNASTRVEPENPPAPACFGSWEDLINALMHNPTPGDDRAGDLAAIQSETEGRQPEHQEPDPVPWRGAVTDLVRLACLKAAASEMAEGPAQTALLESAERGITTQIKELWRPHRHRHWPGPPAWVFVIAATLMFAADTVQDGNVQNELHRIASQMVQQSAGGWGGDLFQN